MLTPLVDKKVTIDEFIKNHNHINYCEAIIYPDGEITYAVPSHEQMLIKISGKTMEEIQNLPIDIFAIIPYLCDKTNCISVWYDRVICPSVITSKQIDSLSKLMKSKCIEI